MNQLEYEKINNFIYKVFNFYNGKINPINIAKLDINWANQLGSNAAGYSKLPNIIVINPMVIYNYHEHNNYVMYAQIIETIIHELFHTDQIIDYNKYCNNQEYNFKIESPVYIQTTIYIANHINEIYNTFGIDMRINKNDFNNIINIWDLSYNKYERRTAYYHLIMNMNGLLKIPNTEEIVNDCISNNKNLYLLNNELYELINHGIINNILVLNNIFMRYSNNGYTNCKLKIINNNEDYIIKIEDFDNIKIMCSKIR